MKVLSLCFKKERTTFRGFKYAKNVGGDYSSDYSVDCEKGLAKKLPHHKFTNKYLSKVNMHILL